jgi:hypothetical protein
VKLYPALKMPIIILLKEAPEEIQTVNDVWSFSRDLNSDDPTWNLTEIAQDVHVKE